MQIIAISQATLSDIFPEAIGLFFLIGWVLSFGASIISFTKYVPDESKQNAKNAFVVEAKMDGLKKVPKKTGAAYTLKFLSHCRGLAVLNTW